jgi:transcriptional regulator with XRE-family HTH domain
VLDREGELARLLREARSHSGLTSQEAANRLGVARTTLTNWERGEPPGPRLLAQLDEAFPQFAETIRQAYDRQRMHTPNRTGDEPSSPTLAICGNPELEDAAAATFARDAIIEFARFLASHPMVVVHGPRGSGIQVVNAVHNRFQFRRLRNEMIFVERERIIAPADCVILIGGVFMTETEAEIAIRMKRRLVPIPRTGGTALKMYERLAGDPDLDRAWLSSPGFARLSEVATAPELGLWLRSDFLPMIQELVARKPENS